MSTQHQDVALSRCLYTGESVQQARQSTNLLDHETPPIPAAASSRQQLLETHVLTGLLECRSVATRYPLGIAAAHPTTDGIALRVESEERAAEILFNLLPTYVSEHEVHGVPGLRITQRDRTAIELSVLGEPARLRLTGLPARLWRSAITRMLSKWIDPTDQLLCWQSSPAAWTDAERGHRARWEDPADRHTRVLMRGAWLGSGILRRIALLHTVSNTFFLDGYRGNGRDVTRVVMRSSHVRGQGPGPHNVVAALGDPMFGLSLRLMRFRGDTDENCGPDQQFVLGDADKTAVLDLRATTEPPPSAVTPDLWQSILRRLPKSGFTSGPPSVLADLTIFGAA